MSEATKKKTDLQLFWDFLPIDNLSYWSCILVILTIYQNRSDISQVKKIWDY